MKLRTIGMSVVAALALVASSAQAQEAGWDTKYGVLFTLPNLLQNGSSSVINDYNGLVGFQMNLGPQAAFRLSADLSRTSTGITETKFPTYTTKSVPGTTSSYGVTVKGEYMMRMSTAAIAPYAGLGAFVGANDSIRNGTAVDAVGNKTDYDESNLTYGLGAIGKLGLEWRIHKVISLFAEYEADLTLASGSSVKVKDKFNGVVTQDTTSKRAEFANFSTGLSNGGRLGVIAFF